ncbi:MAG: 16S rRNA (guanine(966)-N(2))-methyltransferase RsmD [Desulfobacterales bacterium]|jgi:16S rRNA (guanine966-N2)-methyltransferase|nr:16S rRNA (guanine(966)-N(2))-methyltransferase RsmD [Desulfobacterales bacterium]
MRHPEKASFGGLRVIAGDRRGKKLFSVSGLATRPTASRVREAVFNMISDTVPNAVVLDLYAGTGILGIEALSRGARFALFVDNSHASLEIIRKNIAACRFQSKSDVMNTDIKSELMRLRAYNAAFNLVFMDPPYHKGLIQTTLCDLHNSKALATRALIVVEHALTEPPPINMVCFHLKDQRKYGKTLVSFVDYTI